MSAVIKTSKLSKRFAGGAGLHGLDLEVPPGAVFALLGDNGAGKSTTIKLLTGLLPRDGGTAEVLGKDAFNAAIELRQKVGYVSERPKFYDWMTVDEIGGFAAGFYVAGFRERYRELVAGYGLRPEAKLKVLSKGEYAKVGLALALAHDPEVLILDEPTSGLDVRVRREFLASMVDLAAAGKTVLISSHQIAEVERVASHIAILSRGRLVLSATMDELRQRVVRYRLRHEGAAPSAERLGVVLDNSTLGRMWEAVVLDPRTDAVDELRHATGIADFEASPLPLEEAYTALVRREGVAS